eukprot:SAG11_NODE_1412_length_4985_cov_14.954769_2_plen_184_part_00
MESFACLRCWSTSSTRLFGTQLRAVSEVLYENLLLVGFYFQIFCFNGSGPTRAVVAPVVVLRSMHDAGAIWHNHNPSIPHSSDYTSSATSKPSEIEQFFPRSAIHGPCWTAALNPLNIASLVGAVTGLVGARWGELLHFACQLAAFIMYGWLYALYSFEYKVPVQLLCARRASGICGGAVFFA